MAEILNKTLELLDIEDFIRENKCKKVTSPQIFIDAKSLKLHPEGIYSEIIFGRRGSRDRFQKFGYIEAKFTFIHPIAIDILKSLFTRKVIDSIIINEPVYITKTGALVSSTDADEKTQILNTIQNIDEFKQLLQDIKEGNIDTDEAKLAFRDFYIKQDEKSFQFVLDNLEKIFINKWLVIPAGYRDIMIYPNGTYREMEISEAYRKLIDIINMINESIKETEKEQSLNTDNDDELLSLFAKTKQEHVSADVKQKLKIFYARLQNIVDLILNQISGKTGLFRGSKLSKRVDHVVRLVLGHNKDLDINQVQIPWMFLIKLYEPFVIYHITKNPEYSDLKEYFESNIGVLSPDNFREFFNEIVRNPSLVPKEIKERLIQLLQYIIDGKHEGDIEKYVLVIRHPVESRDSILFLRPVIDREDTYVARLPQVLFATLGADCSHDTIQIKVNNKYITTHLKDLPKYVKHRIIEEYDRPDGVHVKIAELLEDVEILSYDRDKKEFVYDKIVYWHEHSNIKMNKVILDDGTEFIMSPSKETLVTPNDDIIKPIKENIGREVLHIEKKGVYIKDIQENVSDIGWDITTLNTGTYVDIHGYVKKQCDGNYSCHR
jgi:DNA-directed RNA polymerase beta' subunit